MGERRTALILLLIICFSVVTSIGLVNPEPTWMMWSQTCGGTSEEGMATFHDVHLVRTFDGGLALAGGTLSFGAGDYDFWLIKTNEQGVPEFPPWVILPLFAIVTLAVIICRNRLRKKK